MFQNPLQSYFNWCYVFFIYLFVIVFTIGLPVTPAPVCMLFNCNHSDFGTDVEER